MALSLTNPETQTWEFPAAASATNKSNSIFIPGRIEIVGFYAEAMEATTAQVRVELTADGVELADASATFTPADDEAGTDLVYVVGTAAVACLLATPLRGPIRARLSAETGADVAVNQDGQVITPIFRQISTR